MTLENVDKPFHKQLMLRGYSKTPPQNTEDAVKWMNFLITYLKMNTLQGPFSSYVDKVGNRGLTAVAMIETSHIAFHVWDEQDPALVQFDLYTCGSMNVSEVLVILEQFFGMSNYEYLVYDRENGFDLIHSESKPAKQSPTQ